VDEMNDREHELPEEIAQRIVTMVVLTDPGADLRLKRKIATAIRQAYEGMDRLEAERDEADRRAGAAERELTHYRDRVNKLEAAFWWMFEVNPKIKDGLATVICTEEQWREAKAVLAAPTIPKE
jgi:chromosome segregation ATPase